MDRHDLSRSLSAGLDEAVSAGLPGVVAAVTVAGETVFEGAAGVRAAGSAQPMTVDTVLVIASMTKAITGAAAMQLVEQGRLSLDRPAGEVLADLADVPVLDGFDADGTPRLRSALRPITLRHLLTHTSGFVYDMWSADLTKYLEATGTPSFTTLRKDAFRVPIMFDPGDRWDYGIGIDWVGLLVEEVTGQTLGAYCAQHLFGPLEMRSTAFAPTPDMAGRAASVHVITPDGCVALPPTQAEAPEFEMGGGGLLSTAGDYLRFTNMILNGGVLDGNRVLQPETVAEMSRNNIGDVEVASLTSVNPGLTCDVDLFPGQVAKYGLSFIINTERSAQGRPAGSLGWAGLANSYYWIDPVNRLCAVWATQLFPFASPMATEHLHRFETTIYDHLPSAA